MSISPKFPLGEKQASRCVIIYSKAAASKKMKHYDLVVIGTGPAGHHGAIQAAKLGKKVAIAEVNTCLGGACINTGTIPSKTLREAVLHLSGFKQRGLYGSGYDTNTRISSEDLARRVDQVIRTEIGVFSSQFRRNGVDILIGQASFDDPHVLRVANQDAEVR